MRLGTALCVCAAAAALAAPALAATNVSIDPQEIGKPPIDNWTTFNGDYSGQRYSTLTQITPANVNQIAEQWVTKLPASAAQRGSPLPVIKCTPLLVDGVLYITIPDHVWALDARDGNELWHYDWVDHGGHLIGQRGVGIWKSTIYFETPDNWLHCPRREHRQRTVAEKFRRRPETVFLHLGAAGRPEPCHCRGRRRRHGHAGLS